MSDAFVVRARKIMTNRLLSRKQMILDVIHPKVATIPKEKIRPIIANKFKTDPKNVVLFGFKTQFGGFRSSGFALIYDNEDFLKKYEPKVRLRRVSHLILNHCRWDSNRRRKLLLRRQERRLETSRRGSRARKRLQLLSERRNDQLLAKL